MNIRNLEDKLHDKKDRIKALKKCLIMTMGIYKGEKNTQEIRQKIHGAILMWLNHFKLSHKKLNISYNDETQEFILDLTLGDKNDTQHERI